jgi:nitrate/TMAO reductase-like tetraheme cytochrome c subunit
MTQPTPPEPEVAPAAPTVEETSPAEAAPARRRRKRWPIFLAGLAAIGFLLVFFIASTEILHWTESTAFCSLCHVMKPEYTTYHNSAHARAECGTCHIGPGAIPAIQAKLANARYLWVYPLNRYERPIPSPIHSLRPVEVVCEQCHWPEKHYTDRVVVKNQYATDEENSLTQVAFNVRTGGGRENEGQGRGIHWHIANPVYYIATDEKLQDIPWVSAEFDGVVTEYMSVDSNLTPDALAKYEKRKMDCVDCHNRASHNFRRPNDVLDEAIAQGVLPALPYIKDQGVKVLEQQYATEEEAAAAIAAVEDFYKNEHPDIYAEREAEVRTAVTVLQEIFDRTQFPFMNVTWESHRNNIGHKDFPGCFRCHDGKHLSADNQAIRLECNLCHTIPQVAGPGQVLQPVSSVPAGNEPDSHVSTTWLSEHRFQFDASCEACHTTDNPGGSDNTSFCSNSACHATEWAFAGLNAPQIRELSAPPRQPGSGVPNPIPHPVNATTDCQVCHAADAVHPYPENHTAFTNDMCAGCHTSSQPVGQDTGGPQPVSAPAIPHQLEGMSECSMCHALDAMKPFPESHASFTNDQCANCHQPGEGVTEPGATSTPEAAPEATPEAAPTTEGVAAAPEIPHDLAGRDNCLMCHDPAGGLKPAPSDHVGRTNDTCQGCHRPES